MTTVQIKQTIGQLEASIDKIEPLLDIEEFKEYCDGIATAITFWKVELKKQNDTNGE